MSSETEPNIAEILRDISLNSTHGKSVSNIIKKAQKAANKGLFSINVEVPEVEYCNFQQCLREHSIMKTPIKYNAFFQKLIDSGFKISLAGSERSFFDKWLYYINVSWE